MEMSNPKIQEAVRSTIPNRPVAAKQMGREMTSAREPDETPDIRKAIEDCARMLNERPAGVEYGPDWLFNGGGVPDTPVGWYYLPRPSLCPIEWKQ